MEIEEIEYNQWQVIKNAKQLEEQGKRPMEDHEKVIYDRLSKKFGK
ncbi:hypothetical protein ES702_02756 [subsurface metagenome]